MDNTIRDLERQLEAARSRAGFSLPVLHVVDVVDVLGDDPFDEFAQYEQYYVIGPRDLGDKIVQAVKEFCAREAVRLEEYHQKMASLRAEWLAQNVLQPLPDLIPWEWTTRYEDEMLLRKAKARWEAAYGDRPGKRHGWQVFRDSQPKLKTAANNQKRWEAEAERRNQHAYQRGRREADHQQAANEWAKTAIGNQLRSNLNDFLPDGCRTFELLKHRIAEPGARSRIASGLIEEYNNLSPPEDSDDWADLEAEEEDD